MPRLTTVVLATILGFAMAQSHGASLDLPPVFASNGSKVLDGFGRPIYDDPQGDVGSGGTSATGTTGKAPAASTAAATSPSGPTGGKGQGGKGGTCGHGHGHGHGGKGGGKGGK